VLSTRTRGVLAIGDFAIGALAAGASAGRALLAGAFIAGALLPGALAAPPFAPAPLPVETFAGAFAPDTFAAGAFASARAFCRAEADGFGATSVIDAGVPALRGNATIASEPEPASGDGISIGLPLPGPPKQAGPESASRASSGAIERRLPDGNANGSPVEDAHRIVPVRQWLKCEKTAGAAKGDSRQRDAFSCHPASRSSVVPTGPAEACSAAARTTPAGSRSLQTEGHGSASARACTSPLRCGARPRA